MKSLTPGEKESLRRMIREYHANRAIEIAKELEKPVNPHGNITEAWIEIIRSLSDLLRKKK